MKSILLAGVAVADFIFYVEDMPRESEKYRANDGFFCSGGNAANSAVAVSRLGGKAILAARIGSDVFGDLIVGDLEKEFIDTSIMHRIEGGQSSFSSIYIDRAGERQILNFRGKNLGENADWLVDTPEFDALLADNRWPPLTHRAIQLATSRNVPIVIDAEPPFDRDAVEGATHVAFSYQGLTEFTGIKNTQKALMTAAETLETWVCVTDGENGTYFIENGVPLNVPAVKVEAVDTLGAGDVWHAAFTLMLAEGVELRQAIHFANSAGTVKCLRPGGRNGAPTRSEVEQFMTKHKPIH